MKQRKINQNSGMLEEGVGTRSRRNGTRQGSMRLATSPTRGKALRRVIGGVLGVGLAFLLAPRALPKESSELNTRIVLIRGLAREVAVAKVPMPRGKKGIFVDPQGKVDKEKSDAELRTSGLAIKPGTPVEITKMTFKSDAIIFELNGGGKNRRKWYQHIQIGMGTPVAPVTTDQPTTLAYGSQVTLTFPGKLPEVTVDQVKQMLAGVLDFTRHSPTVLYSPKVPPQFKEAIKKHEVVAGMDRDAVLSSKGPPDRKVREVRDSVEQEDWIYGTPPHVLFVTFDGDTVTKVTQY